MKPKISSMTDRSGSLLDACMKPMIAYTTKAMSMEVPVV